MKIHLLSDIHNNSRRKYTIPEGLDYDVLVVAGDIDENPERLIEYLASIGKPVVSVLGNHDYWTEGGWHDPHEDIWQRLLRLRKMAAETDNVYLLERDAIVIDGVRFLGTTLWTNYRGSPELMKYGFRSMNDFSYIGASELLADPLWREGFERDLEEYGFNKRCGYDFNAARFHPVMALNWHEKSCQWLKDELRQTDSLPDPDSDDEDARIPATWKSTVVVTHHAPTDLSLLASGAIYPDALKPKNWVERRLDIRWDDMCIWRVASYASDLEPMLYKHQQKISCWFHGHIHEAIDVASSGVRVVCNPVADYHDFRPDLIIDTDDKNSLHWMRVLQPEVDKAVADLEEKLTEIRQFADLRAMDNKIIRKAIEEAMNSRFSRFGEVGKAVMKRFDSQLCNLGIHRVKTYPTFDFELHAPDSYSEMFAEFHGDRWDPDQELKQAAEFIASLKRIHELPVMLKNARDEFLRHLIAEAEKLGFVVQHAPEHEFKQQDLVVRFVSGNPPDDAMEHALRMALDKYATARWHRVRLVTEQGEHYL